MSEDCRSFASTDPDISGVGVRISFYLQTFILVLLVDRSWQDAPTALYTFIFTSFGLVIAAIANRAELSFFQALQVSNLVWLANFGTFVALASYSRQKAASSPRSKRKPATRERDYGVKFSAMIQTVLSMCLTIYVWANAPSFGTNSQCNHLITYAVFVIKLPALTSGRIVGLTFSSVLTAFYFIITLHELKSYYKSQRRLAQKKASQEKQQIQSPADVEQQIEMRPPRNLALVSSVRGATARSMTSQSTLPPSPSQDPPNSPSTHSAWNSRRRPRRRRWSFDLDPMLVGVIICQIMIFGYFIVSSELLLAYNNDETDTDRNKFGFGQILALVIVLPSFLSLVGALQEHGLKRLSKKKTRKAAKKKVPRQKSSHVSNASSSV